jgi:hypothetical protein
MDQEVKNISSDAEKKPEQVAKYTAKDSVFTSLFREPKYLLQLYQALHPEDHEATEDSIKNVTITNVLLDQYYNDVGFQIGEKIVILVEQQSSWSINIVVRCLLYLAQTYQEYFEATKQNVYGSKKLELPRPEVYVIYTGNRKTRPEYLYLSKEFFGGDDSVLDVKVKMIYDGKEGDIINQYVTFTKIYNEQVKLHGRTREAVLETIRICKDQNVLSEYLSGREKEVVDIMMTLFNEEYILKTYVESKEREATERANSETAKRMYKRGNSIEEIADILDTPLKVVEQWIGNGILIKNV